MSTRIVGTHIAVVLSLLSTLAAAQVAPFPPALVAPQTGPTELDRAYYYSTIGQELAYAKVREDAARKPDAPAPNAKPETGTGLQAPCAVSPLAPILCPPVFVLCPAPSRLLSRLEAAGCRL